MFLEPVAFCRVYAVEFNNELSNAATVLVPLMESILCWERRGLICVGIIGNEVVVVHLELLFRSSQQAKCD
jgi:hypothetical protein